LTYPCDTVGFPIPRYVTAVSRSNTIDGWRDRRADGGVVVDVQRNQIVCEGLSMPHSPRMHNGELWLMYSGTGELGVVVPGKTRNGSWAMGGFELRAFCPGLLSHRNKQADIVAFQLPSCWKSKTRPAIYVKLHSTLRFPGDGNRTIQQPRPS